MTGQGMRHQQVRTRTPASTITDVATSASLPFALCALNDCCRSSHCGSGMYAVTHSSLREQSRVRLLPAPNQGDRATRVPAS